MEAFERVGQFLVVEFRVLIMRNELPERDHEPVLTIRPMRDALRRRRDLRIRAQEVQGDRELAGERLRSVGRCADLCDQSAHRQMDERVVRGVDDIQAVSVEAQPPSQTPSSQPRRSGVRSDALPFTHTRTMHDASGDEHSRVRWNLGAGAPPPTAQPLPHRTNLSTSTPNHTARTRHRKSLTTRTYPPHRLTQIPHPQDASSAYPHRGIHS
jgi:hypothetical protein